MEYRRFAVISGLCLLVEFVVRKEGKIFVHVGHPVKRLIQRAILLHDEMQKLQVIVTILFPSYCLIVFNYLYDPFFNPDLFVFSQMSVVILQVSKDFDKFVVKSLHLLA